MAVNSPFLLKIYANPQGFYVIHRKSDRLLAHPPKTAEQLAQEWLDAKAEENAARAKRIEIEEELLSLLPCREEGSQTSKLENGMRVVTEGRLTRSIDAKALADDWNDLPAIIQGTFHWCQRRFKTDTDFLQAAI